MPHCRLCTAACAAAQAEGAAARRQHHQEENQACRRHGHSKRTTEAEGGWVRRASLCRRRTRPSGCAHRCAACCPALQRVVLRRNTSLCVATCCPASQHVAVHAGQGRSAASAPPTAPRGRAGAHAGRFRRRGCIAACRRACGAAEVEGPSAQVASFASRCHCRVLSHTGKSVYGVRACGRALLSKLMGYSTASYTSRGQRALSKASARSLPAPISRLARAHPPALSCLWV
jgi:hypothetical protein